MKEWKPVIKTILVVLAVVIFWLVSLLALVYVDKRYALFRSILVSFTGVDNHFDGDLWFSAAATLIGAIISAVPGLMCGLLAYIQTERLHELEDRYHRPVMDLDEAAVEVIALPVGSEAQRERRAEEILTELPKTTCEYCSLVDEAIKKGHPFYIFLNIKFHVKNDVAVKRIYIKQIDFLTGGEVFGRMIYGKDEQIEKGQHRSWEFGKQIEAGGIVYNLEGHLYPFLVAADRYFWDVIRDFALYASIRNPESRHLDVNVHMVAEYEYSAKKGTDCMLHAEFDAIQMQKAGCVRKIFSCNGYFTFDIKREKAYLRRKK